MKQCNNKNNYYIKAISLTELSVVIVIIALLAGVVSSGIRLYKASEIRSIITNISAYQLAMDNFVSLYEDLPGDFDEAYDYWGTDCDATDSNCNGDGDGEIDVSGAVDNKENFRAWQHLNLASLIEGGYTGISGTTQQATIGINVPSTKRDGGGFTIATIKSSDSDSPNNYPVGSFFIVGGFLSANWTINKFLTPIEAYSLDNKSDDGMPDTGNIYSRYFYNGSAWQTTKCITGTHPNRTYVKDSDDAECFTLFPILP